MDVQEEHIPVHNRSRVRAGAAGNMGRLPRPLLGSLERQVMLEDAEVLYEKSELLRKLGESANGIFREKGYQKGVLCVPIRSLPLETLSSILLLATPNSFAFNLTQHVAHPLSSVSRAWYEIIKSTPEFYSRINIDTIQLVYRLQELQDAARRLPSWLAKARNTGLNITFHCSYGLYLDKSTYSTGPLHEIWMMLLSLVGNWVEFDYYGAFPFVHQFLEKADSAKSVTFISLYICNSLLVFPQNDALASNTVPSSVSLPRLQHLALSGDFPVDFMTENMPPATSLQALTVRTFAVACLTEDGLRRFAACFPFLKKLRLEQSVTRDLGSVNPLALLSEFKHLQHFELSRPIGLETVALSALNGCRALKTLRLLFSAFRLDDKCRQLPSVDRLEIELRDLDPNREKLKTLFTLLPSLIFLKVSPSAGHSPETTCDAQGLLTELSVLEDSIVLPACPDLAELCLERATISNCDIACFIADRTFNAAPAALKFLEDKCYCRATARTYVPGQHRNARYATWKPTCLVTTSECPGIPDMVNAGLGALVDGYRTGKLILDGGKDDSAKLKCDSDCDCDCRDEECSCCEFRGISDGD